MFLPMFDNFLHNSYNKIDMGLNLVANEPREAVLHPDKNWDSSQFTKKNIWVQMWRHSDRTIQSQNFTPNIGSYFGRNGFYMVNI